MRGWGIRKYINDPRKGGTPGTPDCILAMPDKIVVWVEVKQPATIVPYRRKREKFAKDGTTLGCTKTEIRQFREQQLLEDQGQDVRVVGTYDEVDDLIDILEMTYG